MPGKNDLSSLKVKTEWKLPSQSNELSQTGRKPMSPQERKTEVIGLRFTPWEFEQIKRQAGLVPVATYLKDALYNQTNVFW